MKIIKRKIKEKEKNNKIIKNISNSKKKHTLLKQNEKIVDNSGINKSKARVNQKRKEVVDICTIIKKCSIDEISKYLLKHGKKKDFPNITSRE